MEVIINYWWTVIIYGITFGVVTNMVIKNKGYKENWFWRGFLFGIFALIVACTKQPQNQNLSSANATNSSLPQDSKLAENYDVLFSVEERQYCAGSPVVLCSGKLLKEKATDNVFAKCEYQIVTTKKVKAAFVTVLEYDVSGEYIGQTECQYLDLDSKSDIRFGATKLIALSNNTTRKIEVKCTKIMFASDEKWEATEGWAPLPAYVPLFATLDTNLAEQYKREINNSAKYTPQMYGDLWICTCGSANHLSNQQCVSCGAIKDSVFGKLNKETLQKGVEEKEAKDKKKQRLIAIAAMVALVVAIVWGIASSMQPHIKVVELNTTRGSSAVLSKISHNNNYFQLGFNVEGNFKGTKTLKYRIIYPDGHVTESNWTWDNVKSGGYCGVDFDSGFGRMWLNDTIKFEIVDVSNNKVIGTVKVKIDW